MIEAIVIAALMFVAGLVTGDRMRPGCGTGDEPTTRRPRRR